MGSRKLKTAPLALLLHFMISTALRISQAQLASAPPPPGFPCNLVDCGHGTCDSSSFPLPPFECVCDPGWKQITLGILKLPCILPNCTVDFSCGRAPPPPPPPPPPLPSLFPPLPAINFTDPCSYTDCGDGNCVRTDGLSGYRCDCNEGSANLLSSTALPCACSIGIDCDALLGQPAPPPPTPDAKKNDAGGRQDQSFAANHHVLKVTILLAILCSWI